MTQLSLWDPHYDGETYDPDRDQARLGREMRAVYDLMADGEWRTLAYIAELLDRYPESSISARLRDLRKPRFGGHVVERRYRGSGIWEYRMVQR